MKVTEWPSLQRPYNDIRLWTTMRACRKWFNFKPPVRPLSLPSDLLWLFALTVSFPSFAFHFFTITFLSHNIYLPRAIRPVAQWLTDIVLDTIRTEQFVWFSLLALQLLHGQCCCSLNHSGSFVFALPMVISVNISLRDSKLAFDVRISCFRVCTKALWLDYRLHFAACWNNTFTPTVKIANTR